jgi:hypothetical protein
LRVSPNFACGFPEVISEKSQMTKLRISNQITNGNS